MTIRQAFLQIFVIPRQQRRKARLASTRAKAWRAYQDAKKRGDTRDKHSAGEALRLATNAELEMR